ncbi:hypothetical protein, partial [Streptomyces sp. NPDC017958]|uniref:hypothetical protein n=2 Tax=Streptomyces TaxID=1883 RepID=UPI0037B3EF55
MTTSGRRRALVITGTAVLLTAAAAGALYATGTWDSWQDQRSLSSACQGTLEHAEAGPMLGADRLRAVEEGDGTDCRVTDPGVGKASLDVLIRRSTDDARLLARLDRADSHKARAPVAPMGGDWAGVLNSGEESAYAAAWLPCRKQRDGVVVVSVAAHRDADAERLTAADQEARLARITTGTLANAAEKWGCGAKPGSRIERVPASSVRTLKAAGKATGTCAGIDSPAFEAAADSAAPVEDCVLVTVVRGESERRFRVSSYYGPFARSARLETPRGRELLGASGGSDGLYWTTASCGAGSALYTVEPLDGGDGLVPPDPRRELLGASGGSDGLYWTTASCGAGSALYTVEPL